MDAAGNNSSLDEFVGRLEDLRKALVQTQASTASTFRQALIQYATDAAQGNLMPVSSAPRSLRQLVDKVVFAPYSIEDEDFDHARNELQADDAVLESIYCAALGAGLCRLELANSFMSQTL